MLSVQSGVITRLNFSRKNSMEALPVWMKGRIFVLISENVRIGDSIAYRADKILQSLREKKPCSYPVWYGVTTAFEDENLMYILNGLELRHACYLDSNLKILGLAGSREEAESIVLNFVQLGYTKSDIFKMKQYLNAM